MKKIAAPAFAFFLLAACAQGGGLLGDAGPLPRDVGPPPTDAARVDAGRDDGGAPGDAAPGSDAGPPGDAGPLGDASAGDCVAMADCDDVNACTTDACEVGACVYTPVSEPAGSGCAGAIDISAGGAFSGDSACAASDFTGACSAGDAPDVHFTLTVAATASVTLDSLGTSYDAVLALGSSCLGGELGCDDDTAGGGQARLTRSGLAAGTYHVVLDGKAGAAGGAWALNVAITTGPTMETVSFPLASDTVSYPGDGFLWVVGDYVTGTRVTSLPNATGASMNVSIFNNGLDCDSQDLRMMLNGTEVGRFSVAPGATSVASTFSFPSITGPTYTLRYETVRTVNTDCGAAQVGPGGSVTLTR